MLYNLRRKLAAQRFDRAIAGILETKPLRLEDAPWCVAGMVADRDVPMYVLALKAFYPRLGRGKVVAIIDRGMSQSLRDTLARHIVGIEFAILEDIPTGTCQRGGTWERLLYCLDRSEREYTIQMDCDTLPVDGDLPEVLGCIAANRSFTMSDGFSVMDLPAAASLAQATPSDYIGIFAERQFDRYPDAMSHRYVRGSSGFAGFAKGGFTRARISTFHAAMETLVGKARWREWGSEQCGSNFAIANAPNPYVLPYPDYASFTPRLRRNEARFLHFIGRFRYDDGFFAARGQDAIAAASGAAGSPPQRAPRPAAEHFPLAFARNLTLATAPIYLAWIVRGRQKPVWVQMQARAQYRPSLAAAPWLQLRPRSVGNNDQGVAYEIFVHDYLSPPVWIPPELVETVVDMGANVGISCLFWLANYRRAHVIAFEPHPGHAAQCLANVARNGWEARFSLHHVAVGPEAGSARISDAGSSSSLMDDADAGGHAAEVVDVFPMLQGHRIDILKIDIEGSEVALLNDPRFATLDIRALVMEWHAGADGSNGRSWCLDRLAALGFRCHVVMDDGRFGMVWGFPAVSPP